MILVAGATGYLGGEICSGLRRDGHAVRGLVRTSSDPAAVARLREIGAETVTGDLRDPESLLRACAGVDTVISTVTTTRSRQDGDSIEATDQQGQLNLVEAARSAGASRFIFVSFSKQIGGDDPMTRAKRTIERAVQDSGMIHTILRPSCFMEVWLSPHLGFEYDEARATIYGEGTNPLSWISLADVAAFAIRSLAHPDARNAAIELGGPEALSPLQVVRIFEAECGRSFAVQHVPVEALRAQKAAATDSLQESFAALMLSYAAGDPIPMDETARAFDMRLRSVRDHARSVCLRAQAAGS